MVKNTSKLTEPYCHPMQSKVTITVDSAGTAAHLWAWNNAWPELLHPVAGFVDSALPKSPYYTHIMLKYKPDWIETFVSTDDLCFGEYPNESIAEWHERLENS